MSAAPLPPLVFDLSGIVLRLEAFPREMADRLRADWRPFVSTGTAEPDLRIQWYTMNRPIPDRPFVPKQMSFESVLGGACYTMHEGEIAIPPKGTAHALIARNLAPDRAYYTARNLIRAALAWFLPFRPALLVHAAGLVLNDRAFLLVGAEGSGKSTWAELGERAGGRVLSDDLVLVDASGERIEALGAPFRSTHRNTCGPGRWPLAAVLLPRHGKPPRLDEVHGLRLRAALTANLPFVTEAIGFDSRIVRAMERIITAVPARTLTFGRDTSFVPLLSTLRGTSG